MTSALELARACRCQLLIGFFSESSICCPCLGANDCSLNQEQRNRLYQHPRVSQARQKNRAEFEAISAADTQEIAVPLAR